MGTKVLRRLATPILVVAFCLGVLLRGATVEAVTVELQPGAEEPGDSGLLGGERSAPDYRLELKVGGSWTSCGTHKDTPVGAGLRFEVPGTPSRALVTDLRLVEDDAADDDRLEELPIEGGAVEGAAFRFRLEGGWSLAAGIDGFLGTPVGLALGMVVALAVVVSVGSFALRNAFD